MYPHVSCSTSILSTAKGKIQKRLAPPPCVCLVVSHQPRRLRPVLCCVLLQLRTRVFGFPTANVLIPVIDMGNHDNMCRHRCEATVGLSGVQGL